MKKVLIMTAVVLLVFVTALVSNALSPRKNLKPSEYNLGTTYEIAIRDKKPAILLFYTDWCTYCLRFMPKYKMVEDIYKDKYNFVMINMDDPNYASLIKDYAIGGMPTLYIIDPQIDNRILISNTLYDDLSKLRVEFDRYLRIRSMIFSKPLK